MNIKIWEKIPQGEVVLEMMTFSEKKIEKILIIETKGEGFAPAFAEKKAFMEEQFVPMNNERYGYKRFDFLYLEDTLTAEQRRQKTLTAINDFFNM